MAIEVAGPLTRVDGRGVSFFADRRYRNELRETRAGACFLREAEAQHAPADCVLMFTDEPHAAYAKVAERLHPARRWTPEAAIHPTAELEADVGLAPGVVIGPGAQIGRGTTLGPYAVIGPGVAIGRDCVIGAQTSISFALVGDRVKVMAGAIIGEPGFGVTTSDGKALDVPQLGRVIIQDGVSVGAGSCIDRGAWDDTVIGEQTKIDNLVQIAHNVRLGRNCLLAAHTGISGSCEVGDGVAFGGRAGIADHIRIGDGARIAAAAGVMKDVPAGEMWVGSPARPIRRFMRETAWLAKMAKVRGEGSDE
jgi:UDP-3-O-[3-hydroxymyristoyl] glucosamine N-acyltransferase